MILPAAFLALCRTSFSYVFRSDEYRLALDEIKAYAIGFEFLMEKQTELTFGWLHNTIAHHGGQSRTCTTASKQALQARLFPINKPTCRALDPWDESWNAVLCSGCIQQAKQMHREGREEIWAELPQIFGLPGWNELLTKD